MEFDKTRWSCPWNSDQNYTKLSQGLGGLELGADIRTKVKSLKIDIAERTRSSESLLLKMTYINIFAENHKKNKEILSENVSRQIMTSLGHMTSFDRPSCQDVGCFIHNM